MMKLVSLLVLALTPAFVYSQPIGFTFDEGELPQPCIWGSGRMAQPRNDAVTVGQDTERPHGPGVCLTADPARGGIFLRDPHDAVVLGEPLTALTLAVAFRSSPVSPSPVFVERLVRSSSSNPGFFRFRAQRNGGDDSQRSGTLRFNAHDEHGKSVSAASTVSWVQTADSWNWVGMVFHEGKVVFYLNGERLGDEVKFPVKTISGADGGAHYVRAGYSFAGAFDDLFILPNKALSDDEMRILYQNGMRDESLKKLLQ